MPQAAILAALSFQSVYMMVFCRTNNWSAKRRVPTPPAPLHLAGIAGFYTTTPQKQAAVLDLAALWVPLRPIIGLNFVDARIRKLAGNPARKAIGVLIGVGVL